MTDTLAQLDEVIFPDTTKTGDSFGLNGLPATSRAYTYDFTAGSTFSDTVEVVVTDRAGNETPLTFTLILRTQAIGPILYSLW
jgi:fermentation-respiration switch protein FrsA (DUF1100 family)